MIRSHKSCLGVILDFFFLKAAERNNNSDDKQVTGCPTTVFLPSIVACCLLPWDFKCFSSPKPWYRDGNVC